MDPDLENVIRQALADAEAVGRDHLAHFDQVFGLTADAVDVLVEVPGVSGQHHSFVRM